MLRTGNGNVNHIKMRCAFICTVDFPSAICFFLDDIEGSHELQACFLDEHNVMPSSQLLFFWT